MIKVLIYIQNASITNISIKNNLLHTVIMAIHTNNHTKGAKS